MCPLCGCNGDLVQLHDEQLLQQVAVGFQLQATPLLLSHTYGLHIQ